MATITSTPLPQLVQLIEAHVRKEVQIIATQVIAEAEEQLRVRVAAKMDEMALHVIGQYDMQRSQSQLVITVRKPE